MDVYVGFDSAWADNPKAPGAICAVGIEDYQPVGFYPPRLVSFAGALAFIREVTSNSGTTLVALDQPTLVPNLISMRPVERVAASLISWLGGGVQPSNRGRIGMFCDNSPVWPFLSALNAIERPEEARIATSGLYLMEVFPAIALASMHPDFFGRLKAPRYNPDRKKTFLMNDWARVTRVAAESADSLKCAQLAEWCRAASELSSPRKADQDKLDSVLCALIALRWRLREREASLILGDATTGYMVMPVTPDARNYLRPRAAMHGVRMDGVIPAR